jgi:hypothetical protein
MWYAQSEANYREAFRIAREAGTREPGVPVVIFFDEVDAVGGARGRSLQGTDDRVLTAFMAELDGLESRGNILVVAATIVAMPRVAASYRLGSRPDDPPANRSAARGVREAPRPILYAASATESDRAVRRRDLIEAAVARSTRPTASASWRP